MALPGTNPNAEWERLKASASQARMPFERDAWLNVAFYLGQQYVSWNGKNNCLAPIPRNQKTPNVPRPVVNKIMVYIQQELSTVLQDRPSPDVLPATDDLTDQMDSAVARAYCDHVADPTEADYDRALSRASLWALITGNGFVKWCWNAREKKHEIVPCNFFELYLDPYATDFAKNRYLIHSKFMDVEQVEEVWNKKVQPTQVEQADLMRTELLRGMGAAPVLAGATVNELWLKPCRKHPSGLYVVWTGREVLDYREGLPYNHGQLPYTQIGCIERPDSQYFMSPVTYLRPAQMELNKFHAQEIYAREKYINYKWWIDAQIQLEEMPNDAPFQILTGDGGPTGLRPEIIAPPPLPVTDHGNMIEQQMMHIVGQHEVSQAQVPGRVEAAKAIEMLKDSDDSRQETMRKTINTTTAIGFYQILENARQFEDEEKMVLTYSRDGGPEVKHFRAGELKPGYRVRTTMTTGLARTRAARWDQLQRMWDSRIITDPETMAELMEVPIPHFVNYKFADLKLARNENLEMAKGTAIVPNSWDDHALHLREHNTYRKTGEFQALPDKTKQKFEFHCEAHDNMLDAQLQKDAARAQLQAQIDMASTGNAPPPGPAEQSATSG